MSIKASKLESTICLVFLCRAVHTLIQKINFCTSNTKNVLEHTYLICFRPLKKNIRAEWKNSFNVEEHNEFCSSSRKVESCSTFASTQCNAIQHVTAMGNCKWAFLVLYFVTQQPYFTGAEMNVVTNSS